MTFTWDPDKTDTPEPISPGGWVLVVLRGLALVGVLLLGVLIKSLVRLVERPIFGARRPASPWITVTVCKAAFLILGIRHRREGQPMRERGALVANHSSWLDIFSLNAAKTVYFVSKSEVANWPGIGLLARITGTVFIARNPAHAAEQKKVFEERLLAGHKLLFFPEGTSTDGWRVLPFKSTLFAAFFTRELREVLHVQAVTVIYTAPDGASARIYGWWGDMDFAPHLLKTLSLWRQGEVLLRYHPPVKVADFADRKALARHLEIQVRGGMPPERRLAR